ncbi:MAG: acetyl-CoA carboxylase biotin carboxylase subunit [Saprospiraceae bacterium]
MQSILVANRGEIALRIMRTARRMGIRALAVYSDADRDAPHVRYADAAYRLGPAPAGESYLRTDLILKAAREMGAEAIHPGYGFLSENASFAEAVAEAGLIFIGPSAHAIDLMGNKLAAKAAVQAYDVPLVPGTATAIADLEEARRVAKEIGFPLLVKAAAGGGGKGMRAVQSAAELDEQLGRAVSEAKNAFGDGSVFIERLVQQPRHIELQVLADNHGNIVHLFERDCSIQRRHQKVVEEAPSAVLTPELRARMGKAAVDVARAAAYSGAGTVEFLLDASGEFFFLEMNTRLQVEHPVTELITGLDLVEQQIRVARGEELAFTQDDLTITGHALELRVYAEDPAAGFLPSIGTLHTYRPPSGPGIRVDDGFREGMEVPIHYDPMLSKLVVYAADRPAALRLLQHAIDNYTIEGVATTLPFGRFVAGHPAFVSGHFDTGFVAEHFSPELLAEDDARNARAAARLAADLLVQQLDLLQVVKS